MGVMCRAHTFAKPEVIQLASDQFVAVTESINKVMWQRDVDTEFFLKIWDQVPKEVKKKNKHKQGIYVFTAGGKLLNYCNSYVAGRRGMEEMEKGLAAWKQLPNSRRRPNAVQIPSPVKLVTHRAPPGGLILRVYSRQLDRSTTGEYYDANCQVGRGDEASFDNMWLKRHEWQSLIPQNLTVGQTHSVPRRIANRIARFHLRDRTRGAFPAWPDEFDVRSNIKLTVLSSTGRVTRLKVDGSALIGQRNNSSQGYDATLGGVIEYNRGAQKITRFDIVAIGDQWGGPDIRARKGFNPLGVAFELSDGDPEQDNAVPGGVGDSNFMRKYFGR